MSEADKSRETFPCPCCALVFATEPTQALHIFEVHFTRTALFLDGPSEKVKSCWCGTWIQDCLFAGYHLDKEGGATKHFLDHALGLLKPVVVTGIDWATGKPLDTPDVFEQRPFFRGTDP